MAFTIGKYLHNEVLPKEKGFSMNVSNLAILEGQVAKGGKGGTQLLQLEATIDTTTRSMPIQLYNILDDGSRASEPYGSCCVTFEDASSWRREWARLEHLVLGRISTLQTLAREGKASKLTRNMAYSLFKNIVDYADRYRGMQSVVINDYEAYSEITLSAEEAGIWHTPPHWIDSVAHLAGLVVNGSDASNTADYFYVTPGWESMRFGKPLEAGASYQNYVKMIPTEEKGVWAGDVYVLQDKTIIGMVGQIKFRQFPRVLMDRFFSPNKAPHHTAEVPKAAASAPAPVQLPKATAAAPSSASPASASASTRSTQAVTPSPPTTAEPKPEIKAAAEPAPAKEENSMLTGVVDLVAAETGLDRSELTDDTLFASVGVDSLMSLVLVEKFKANLKVEIKSSLFLECPTIGEFKEWMEENR